jgi:hypothetical protein
MTESFSDELLSAYLDGELSAEERARVEQRLAESPELRRLCDELRALSATLHAMPRYELDEDVRRRVLRRAERAMLAAPTEQPVPVKSSEERHMRWPVRRSLRPLVWASMAVAAALALMVVYRRPEADKRPVAERRLKQLPDASLSLADGPVASEPEESAPEPRLPEGTVVDGGRELTAPGEAPSRHAGQVARSAPTDGAAPAKPAGGADLEEESVDRPARRLVGPSTPLDVRDEQPSVERKEGLVETAESDRLAAARSREPSPRGDRGTDWGKATSTGIIVVRLAVSREAADKGAFETLLAGQGIVWEEEDSQAPRDGATGRQRITLGSEVRDDTASGKSEAAQSQVLPWDLVYVEATAAQVRGALADMKADPERFPAVDVGPTLTDRPGARRETASSGERAAAIASTDSLGVKDTAREGRVWISRAQRLTPSASRLDLSSEALNERLTGRARRRGRPPSGAAGITTAPQSARPHDALLLADKADVSDTDEATFGLEASGPLRVLFVLRVAQAPPAAPNAEPPPTEP